MGIATDNSGVNSRNDYFIKPIERLLEKQWEEMSKKISSEIASIELIIAHQKSMGTHILTIDNINARKINDTLADFSHMKQDTFTAADKRVYQWASVAFSVISGCLALSSVGAGVAQAAKTTVDALKAASDAGQGFSRGSDTMTQMTESTHQASHTRIDHESQQGRTQKDAMMQSENRMKGSNDNIANILVKYYEALYQLRIALARMN